MKTRESGMPDEELWASFFQPELILDRLCLRSIVGDVAEFGCGYGTFTIPAARRCTGVVYALDIEPEMVALTQEKAAAAGVVNVHPVLRDIIAAGTGLSDATADYCMVFNILHAEHPVALLREARRVLKPSGLLGVMHWNYDSSTPRGPSMAIRPKPEQCARWAEGAGLVPISGLIDLPPFHYGRVFAPSVSPEKSSTA